MKYFAEISNENVVLRVLVTEESQSAESLAKIFGGIWLETSMTGEIRKNYAGVGMIYDSELDAFIPSKPFDSWVINKESAEWEPPVAYPENGSVYSWNEEIKDWTLSQ